MLALQLSSIGLPPSKSSLAVREDESPPVPALLHIPKTGGTGIEDLGQRVGIEWGIHRQDWPEKPHPVGCSPWHIPRTLWQKGGQDPYAGSRTFCVLRHPYTRMVSQFVWRAALDAGCGYPTSAARCPDTSFCTAEKLNAYVDKTVGANLQSLKAIDTAAVNVTGPGGAMEAHAADEDCHLLPQWLYTEPACDYTLHYENLATEFRQLFTDLQLPDLADADLVGQKANSAPCEMHVGDLNATSRELLHDAYRRDFDSLGYDPELATSASAVAASRTAVSSKRVASLFASRVRVAADELVGLDSAELRALADPTRRSHS